MHLSRTTRVAATAAAALIALVLAGCSDSEAGSGGTAGPGTWAKAEGTIIFGAVPDKAGSDMNNRPLQDYIAQQTGYKVEYYPTADYTALIAAAVAGKIDVMSSGALQYVIASNKGAELEPVAAMISSPGLEEPGYYSQGVAAAGSPITSLADIAGKKVCFVDPNSTSGFLFGLYQLKEAGYDVDPSGTDVNGDPTFEEFTPVFAGAHDKVIQSIVTGQCDVGFVEDTVAQAAAAKGEVAVVSEAHVPGGPLSISSALPESVKDELRTVLQGATLEAVTASGVTLTDGFKDSFFGARARDAAYYQEVVDLCSSIPAAKCAA